MFTKDELDQAVRVEVEKVVQQQKTKAEEAEEHSKLESELKESLKLVDDFKKQTQELAAQVKQEQEKNSELQMQMEVLSSYATQVRNVEELEKKAKQNQQDYESKNR